MGYDTVVYSLLSIQKYISSVDRALVKLTLIYTEGTRQKVADSIPDEVMSAV
jgi:hypothetical protein